MIVILAAILGAIVAVSLAPLAKWLYERMAPYRRRRAVRRYVRINKLRNKNPKRNADFWRTRIDEMLQAEARRNLQEHKDE